MKTVERNGQISRVKDEVAFSMVNNGTAKYVPKSEWKKIRDLDKKKEVKETSETSTEKKVSKKKSSN